MIKSIGELQKEFDEIEIGEECDGCPYEKITNNQCGYGEGLAGDMLQHCEAPDPYSCYRIDKEREDDERERF